MKKIFSNQIITNVIIIAHLILTLVSAALFFTGTSELYAVLGSHVVVYPVLGLAIAASLQSILIVAICFLFCGIAMTALAVGWYSALKNKRYSTLMIVSVADAVFSVFILILNLSVGQFTSFHILMIFGILFAAVFAVYMFFLHQYHKPKEEEN